MKINIDGQEMEELLSKAILASLDEAKREIVHGVAQRIANEMIASDEVVMGKIRALIDDALMKVLEENRENVVSKVALAIWTTRTTGRGSRWARKRLTCSTWSGPCEN